MRGLPAEVQASVKYSLPATTPLRNAPHRHVWKVAPGDPVASGDPVAPCDPTRPATPSRPATHTPGDPVAPGDPTRPATPHAPYGMITSLRPGELRWRFQASTTFSSGTRSMSTVSLPAVACSIICM